MRHVSRFIIMAVLITTVFTFVARAQPAHAECAIASASNPPTSVLAANMIAGHSYEYVSTGATNQTLSFPVWGYTGSEPFLVYANSTATVFDTSVDCFHVTKVTNALGLSLISCPRTVNFNGAITTDGAGVVTYQWDSSQGMAVGGVHTLAFSGAGTKGVHLSLTYNKAYSGWVTLRVSSPTLMYSNQVNFSGTCR